MSSENPYAPPSIPAGNAVEPEWPTSGVYRDRQDLVLYYASALPPVCLKTGEPTGRVELLRLRCDGFKDKSVPALRRFLLEPVYLVHAPIAESWARRWRVAHF